MATSKVWVFNGTQLEEYSPASGTVAMADIDGLADALAGKAPLTHKHPMSDITGLEGLSGGGTIVVVPSGVPGLTVRLAYRTTDVNAARPTVPPVVSINWEVPGNTEPANIRWDLGDVWTSVYS